MVTFDIDPAAVAEAHRRGTRDVVLPAAWLAGCLVALPLLPLWAVPVLVPLALVFALVAGAGLLRLRQTRRSAVGPLTLTEAGVQYAGEEVDWAHVRSVVARPNSDRLEVRTGCPEPVDGPGCRHADRPDRRWSLSAELFGTTVDGLAHGFGYYVPVEERELLSEDRLRTLLGRPAPAEDDDPHARLTLGDGTGPLDRPAPEGPAPEGPAPEGPAAHGPTESPAAEGGAATESETLPERSTDN